MVFKANKKAFFRRRDETGNKNEKSRTVNDEATTILVYRGDYSEEQLAHYANEADKHDIKFLVKEDAESIKEYLARTGGYTGKENNKSNRKNDLITDFAYVGHASPEKLLLGEYHNSSQVLGELDFQYGSFHKSVEIDLNGCGTAATKEVDADGNIIDVTPRVYNRLKNVIASSISGWQTPVYWSVGKKGKVGLHSGKYMYARPGIRKRLFKEKKLPLIEGKIEERGGSFQGKPAGSWNKNRKVNGKNLE